MLAWQSLQDADAGDIRREGGGRLVAGRSVAAIALCIVSTLLRGGRGNTGAPLDPRRSPRGRPDGARLGAGIKANYHIEFNATFSK